MELRPTTEEESDAFGATTLRAFHREPTERDAERYGPLHEPERSLAWFDEGRIVATTSIFTRALSVPGATVPCAAVTAVGVRSTHRRRGLLAGMMRKQLEDVHARGEPVAALWASEARIYGRFGYGIATRAAQLTARRPAARVAAEPVRTAGPAAEHRDHLPPVYERIRAERPGMLDRPAKWWRDRLWDHEEDREGAQPLQAAVVEDGYALYAVKPHWDDDEPAGEVQIRELAAATPAAHARLWAFLLDQDLTRSVRWDLAPADEPLWLAVGDARAVRTLVGDGLWVRLVDVGAALAGRSLRADPDVVLAVADEVCPWNAGRWRLAGGTCERTEAAPDLELDVATLASAYLGGVSLRELAAAGRVREHAPGALARTADALASPIAPWCPEEF